MAVRLGIDVGGSGVKGAPVDLDAGTLVRNRLRLQTQPSHPEALAAKITRLVDEFPESKGPVGCALPGVVVSGQVRFAPHLDPSWIGLDAPALLSERCGRPVRVINDADAAGLAEARWGAAAGRDGVVVLLTLGTGIGSAVLHNGELIPNTELGHLQIDGREPDDFASNRARKKEDLSFEEWAGRLNRCLAHLEGLFSPSLFVIGGGISKRFGEFGPYLRARAEIAPAALRNDAGVAGAALRAVR